MAGQKRIPWNERAAVIKKEYPMSASLDWNAVFTDDPAILGLLINDILKLDQSRIGKPGKRPSLTESSTADKLRKIQDVDYTDKPFVESFKALCGDRSIRAVASKTNLDKSYVHRLSTGSAVPNLETLKAIAESFGKHPSYFLEYRITYVLDDLKGRLEKAPESSIVFYKKILGKEKI